MISLENLNFMYKKLLKPFQLTKLMCLESVITVSPHLIDSVTLRKMMCCITKPILPEATCYKQELCSYSISSALSKMTLNDMMLFKDLLHLRLVETKET